MQIEFYFMLTEAIRDFLIDYQALEVEDELIKDITVSDSEKGRIPEGCLLGVSSPVAFKILPKITDFCLKNGRICELSAADVARKIKVKLLQRNYLKGNICLTGDVHLNLFLPYAEVGKVLKKLSSFKEDDFFSFKRIFSEEKSKFNFHPVEINWSILIDKLSSLTADLQISKLHTLLKDQKAISCELRLMLLATLSNSELDLEIYFEKLNGKQNIPWYLDRYMQAATQYLALIKEKLGCEIEGELSIAENSPAFLKEAAIDVLISRNVFFQALRCQRAERFFLLLIRQINNFFQIYNQPNYRFVENLSLNQEDLRTMFCLFEWNLIALKYFLKLVKA